MKQKLCLLAILCSAVWAGAQQTSGVITATASSCSTSSNSAGACVILQLNNTSGAASIVVSGTYSATLQFEVSADNQATWASVNAFPPNSSTGATSTTSTGTWQVNTAGYTHIRVRSSAYTSGTAAVNLQANPVSARALGSSSGGAVSSFSGDGTVLSNSGSTGAVTATLATAAAGTLLGNSTGSTAAPTYGTYASYGLAQPLACTSHLDQTHTGDTSNVVLVSCSGIQNMGANARVSVYADMEPCTAAATPYAGCAGANTGTCTVRVGLNGTSGGTTSTITAVAGAAAKASAINLNISNRNATNAQIFSNGTVNVSNTTNAGGATQAFDTTGATFLNVMIQNSVSADFCGFREFVAYLWPK